MKKNSKLRIEKIIDDANNDEIIVTVGYEPESNINDKSTISKNPSFFENADSENIILGKEKVVSIGNETVIVYPMIAPKSIYSAVCVTEETKKLDKEFGLQGTPSNKNDARLHYLLLSTGYCSLGDAYVESVLRYFADVASQIGRFVGLPEDEVRRNIREGSVKSFLESAIETALSYRDWFNDGKTYLKRVNVEGRDFIVPQNLEKRYI